jgi:hypothetical protein
MPINREQPSPSAEPAWWTRALELERADRFKEAEQAILDAEKSIGAWSQVAYLYELRLKRKLTEGDLAGAKDAFERADNALADYASCATSGGEGTALSAERRERVAAMKRELERHGASK